MPAIEFLEFEDLKLDLSNYRTVPQKSPVKALHAMVSIKPDKFWALAESLLQDGFHINENIVVLKSGPKGKDLIVREGNRRVAALKLLHGRLSRKDLTIPSHIGKLMGEASSQWKASTKKVPCAVYEPNEAKEVDKIVARTHGKAQDAGRDPWNAVARARHNRDENGTSEPSLDLLESYLKGGQNVTPYQKERWGGEYPLSILDEAVKAIAKRLGKATSREVVDDYPKVSALRTPIEGVLHAIGSEQLTFKHLRGTDDALVTYGFPALPASGTSGAGGAGTGGGGTTGASGGGGAAGGGQGGGQGTGGGAGAGGTGSGKSGGTKAVASNDPKAVARALRHFQPIGKDREKVVVLLDEIKKLKLHDHPHAFCFLFRSMFEISAKAYCKNQGKSAGIKAVDSKSGMDRKLVDVLRDVTKHLTQIDPATKKTLHGAMAELATPTGFLSVASMNQLIHNATFVISDQHIARLFANVFPLLEAMNA